MPFEQYIGQRLEKVQDQIEDEFYGRVIVYTPAQVPDDSIKPTRLKVFVDEQNVITRIVNG